MHTIYLLGFVYLAKTQNYLSSFLAASIVSTTALTIASRLGGYTAVGPVLQGLNAPINDLSRGCNAEEVYSMSIVTAALSVPEEEKVDEEGLEAIVRAVVETMLAAKKLDK